jgi:hypothetical protein
MMIILRNNFLFLFLAFNLFVFNVKATNLSDEAIISLLTASPGDELYSVFGHSAIRVNDPVNTIDLVFNYGTFDFNTPNFYLQFIRGKLLYKLSVAPMEYFVPEYVWEGRAIYEQVLDLTQQQKQLVFDYLQVNRLPENAYYHYDFFYDNCATRIRDLFDNVLELQWPESDDINEKSLASIRSKLNYEFDYEPVFNGQRTLRDLLKPFLTTMPWSAFGIDLALGLPADKKASPWDNMYLPDEMLIAFALANHSDGRPFVSENKVVLSKTVELSPPALIRPKLVFWMVFVIALASFLSTKWSILFDRVFFSILGLLGLVIVFLWFFTDHITTKTNLNIFWALPSHLYYIWIARDYEHNRAAVKRYFGLVSLLSLITLLVWPIIPQAFNGAFFPIVLTVLIKSLPYAFDAKLIVKGLRSEK